MSTREEFEKWAESQGFSIKEYDPINNSYLDDHADVAWWAWEASARVEREACAVTAWSAGMQFHNQRIGLPSDAREVGAFAARTIRARGDA